jgi:CDP-L-myo-inositol myo-inositolphosphotransferase
MKCLIIAAGKGSRLRHKGDSKPLIPILGIPIVERVIRTAAKAGIIDFCVVTGYNGEKVRSFLDGLAPRLGISIAHVVNDEWEKGNGLSVLKARECMGEERFLLLMSDHLFDGAVLCDLESHPPAGGKVTLAVDLDTSNPLVDMADVTRIACDGGLVQGIGKDLGEFNGFDTGVFLCTSAIFDALEWSMRGDGDTSLSGGIRYLAANGNVNAFDVSGRFWIDVDDEEALERAEDALIESLKGKPADGPVSRLLNRPLSMRLSPRLARTPVTPNQISLFSFILSLAAAWLFAKQGYLPLAAGAVLAQAASIVDGCDGEVARLKFLESDFGGWFDAVLDRYADALLLFGLTWHAFSLSARGLDLFVGFMAIIGSFMLSYTADKYDGLMRSRIEKGGGLRMGRDVRVFMIFVGALLNQPFLTLLVIAVLMNLETARRVVVCRNE